MSFNDLIQNAGFPLRVLHTRGADASPAVLSAQAVGSDRKSHPDGLSPRERWSRDCTAGAGGDQHPVGRTRGFEGCRQLASLRQALSLCLLCVLLQGARPSWSTTPAPSSGLTWSLLTPFRPSQTVGSHLTCPTWMASPPRAPLRDLGPGAALEPGSRRGDRKSTRLNSSH